MRNQLTKFFTDQSGAVSVDWVVLTASIVILATGVGISISQTTVAAGEDLQVKIGSYAPE